MLSFVRHVLLIGTAQKMHWTLKQACFTQMLTPALNNFETKKIARNRILQKQQNFNMFCKYEVKKKGMNMELWILTDLYLFMSK